MANIVSALPFISVVMPVYNGGDYFTLALKSVLAQSYDRFEVVVIDDGSQDDGFAERAATGADPKVKYFHQENAGVAGALNNGLEKMRGDIFCWLSHDDLFEPYKLESQVDYFERLAKRDAVLFSDYDLIDPDGIPFQRIEHNRARFLRAPMLALLTGSINGCTIFAPVDVMKSVGKFDPAYRYTQDYRFWNRLLKDHDFFHQAESLVRYRVHPEQGSNHPQAVVEGDSLWVEMMGDRSEAERVQMMGSSFRFFEQMASHLSASPYRAAEDFARQRARDAYERPNVTVIVPVTARGLSGVSELSSWAASQNIPNRNVLLAASKQAAELVASSGLDVRFFDLDSEVELLNAALPEARGDYVVFQRPGQGRFAGNIHDAVRRMMSAGVKSAALSHPDRALAVRDLILGGPDLPSARLENLAIHRILVDSGTRFEPLAASLEDPAAFVPFAANEVNAW